jgi:hypothetical protein
MNYVKPKRWDIIEESSKHFFLNLFWGMWVENEWRRANMTCGNCGMRSLVTYRDEKSVGKCVFCGKFNSIKGI